MEPLYLELNLQEEVTARYAAQGRVHGVSVQG